MNEKIDSSEDSTYYAGEHDEKTMRVTYNGLPHTVKVESGFGQVAIKVSDDEVVYIENTIRRRVNKADAMRYIKDITSGSFRRVVIEPCQEGFYVEHTIPVE